MKKINKKKILFLTLTIVFISFLTYMGMNKVGPLGWQLWGGINSSGGIAIAGYHPVSYIKTGKAQVGDVSWSYTWNEVEWRFVSQEHLDAFRKDPEVHAPKFGGYCATAVASGMTADIDPGIWLVDDGKLYLFFSDNARKSFVNSISDGIISKAEQSWKQR